MAPIAYTKGDSYVLKSNTPLSMNNTFAEKKAAKTPTTCAHMNVDRQESQGVTDTFGM